MQFTKASEQNAWNAVVEATEAMRSPENPHKALAQWFKARNIDLEQSVFPCICRFDEHTYSGTLVMPERRVIEYFVDLENPDEADFDDVTDQLGPKDPEHPESDVRDLITMSLVYYDNMQTAAA